MQQQRQRRKNKRKNNSSKMLGARLAIGRCSIWLLCVRLVCQVGRKKGTPFFVHVLIKAKGEMEVASQKKRIEQSPKQRSWRSNKRRIVEENALLKQEHDQLLREKESMKIELCACRRRMRKLTLDLGKDCSKIRSLQATIEEKSQSIEALQGCMDQTADERASMASILNPLERYGGLQKITEKPTLVAAVGSVIISLMADFCC
jgi:DNA repair exonuclease SbcCD ATPase subunit